MIKVYTDGACSKNGAKDAIGGWAFCAIDENDEAIYWESGAESHTTNNRMEFTAMLRALEWAAEYSDDNEIEFFTDSALLYNTMTSWINGWARNGWKRKSGAIKNLDLVQALYPYRDRKFNHLRGHAGEKWNEWCDRAAVDARLCLEASEC